MRCLEELTGLSWTGYFQKGRQVLLRVLFLRRLTGAPALPSAKMTDQAADEGAADCNHDFI